MEQFIRTYPDGSRGAYKVAPGSTLPLALATLKPLKRPRRATTHKREFPQHAIFWSTKRYIEEYFRMNSRHNGKIHAYDQGQDHIGLYQPLPDEPAALYQGADSVETVEDDEGGA